MTALAGIYNFDEAPVHEQRLNVVANKLASRAPDGCTNVTVGSIGMVYGAFYTNAHSRLEKQPLVSPQGQILCWDGRLDNREELILKLHEYLAGDLTDAGIVMSAYLNWGIEFLPRILGDFALSLWDARSRSLILARDVIGARDLFFTANNRRVIWSTDLDVVVDASGTRVEVDDRYIAGYLTRGADPDRTPFKNIEAVPPAHSVVITRGSIQKRQYWGLDPDRRITYQSDKEYEEQFRSLFSDAVRCHLRADGPVWADLSGGLDSSSIVCMADELFRAGQTQAPSLETVSCIRDQSPSSNELKFIHCVEERIGKEGHHIPESEFPVLDPSCSEPSVIPNALDIFASYHREVDRLMAHNGARVRLCGNGGDEICNSVPKPSAELSDLLSEGNLRELHGRLRTWAHDRKKPYLNLLWHDTLMPMLPRGIQLSLGHRLVRQLPHWLSRDFVRRTHLRELVLGPRDTFGFALPSNRAQSVSFLCATRELAAGYIRCLQNVEIRLPFLYRPLVEFMQAIPQAQRARVGETRSLQRRALRNLLPTEILNRTGKGIPAEAIMRALAREYRRVRPLLMDSYVARYGYVDQKVLSDAIERIPYGDKRCAEITRLIPLENWLRSLERRRSSVQMEAAGLGSPDARPPAADESALRAFT
jgi:asparagine synthase (glutamine-hydrolysing)